MSRVMGGDRTGWLSPMNSPHRNWESGYIYRLGSWMGVGALMWGMVLSFPGLAVRPGDEGPEVMELQEYLRQAGYFDGPTTGYFGSVTLDALLRFQRANGLDPDGIVGDQTWSILHQSVGMPGDPMADFSEYGVEQPLPPPPVTPPVATSSDTSESFAPYSVSDLQYRLQTMGFYTGELDGVLGPQTEAAIQAAQDAYGVSAQDFSSY